MSQCYQSVKLLDSDEIVRCDQEVQMADGALTRGSGHLLTRK